MFRCLLHAGSSNSPALNCLLFLYSRLHTLIAVDPAVAVSTLSICSTPVRPLQVILERNKADCTGRLSVVEALLFDANSIGCVLASLYFTLDGVCFSFRNWGGQLLRNCSRIRSRRYTKNGLHVFYSILSRRGFSSSQFFLWNNPVLSLSRSFSLEMLWICVSLFRSFASTLSS